MPSLTQLLSNQGHGVQLREAAIMPAADWVDNRVLAATTLERHTLPVGAKYVRFTATTAFFIKFGTVAVNAAIAAADVTDGTGSLYNPGMMAIPAGATHVSLISPAVSNVTMEFWS